jgi:hypothetical protein
MKSSEMFAVEAASHLLEKAPKTDASSSCDPKDFRCLVLSTES